MTYKKYCFYIFLILAASTLVQAEDVLDRQSALLYLVWRLSDAINDFAVRLHNALSENSKVSFVISPLSLANSLGLLHYGAKGKTARELEKVLGYTEANITRSMASRAYKYLLTNSLFSSKPNFYSIELANAVFFTSRLPLNPSFKRKAVDFYRVYLKEADFEENGEVAVAEVNQWIKNKTKNKIKRAVDKLDVTDDLVMVSVAYFSAKWNSPFQTDNTRNEIFFNGGKKRKYVPFMTQENLFLYGKDEDISLLELPFKGNNISMMFILPHKKDSLPYLERKITIDKLFKLMEMSSLNRVQVTIPKFKVSFSGDLNTDLVAMGISCLFLPATRNLTGIVAGQGIDLGDIRHKTFMEIGEVGVESTGSIANVYFKSSLTTRPDHEFYANHPFLFAIIDKRNGMILFVGRVWKL